MGPLTTDIIRLLLQKGQPPQDAATNGTPSFNVGTDIQFNLADAINGTLTDCSQIASVTLAIKPSSDVDAAAYPNLTGTATTATTGWNGNPASLAGQQLIPSYAQYTAGSYTFGVQAGASYSWIAGANDLTLSNSATPGTNLVTGSNLIPSGKTYPYTFPTGVSALLTNGSIYKWIAGSSNDTGVNSLTTTQIATGFFKATGSDTLQGSGSVTAEVYPAAAGNNIVPGAITYPTTTLVQYGTTGLIPSNQTYSTSISGKTYGTYLLTGLTIGSTYIYYLGSNEPSTTGSIGGLTAATGTFVALTSSVLLTGNPTSTVTTQVYHTIGSASTYILSTLTIGQTYLYTINSDTNGSLVCGTTTLTATGFFTALSSSATLTGPGGAAVTATVQLVSVVTTGSFIAAGNTITLTGVSGTSVTAQLTGSVGWQSGSDQLCIIPFGNSVTTLSTPDGGYTTYWLLVTATTKGSNILVLGAGPINAVDSGQGKGLLTNNAVPSGAVYSAATGSAASVTATISSSAVTGFTGLSGGGSYSQTNPPAVVITGGGGTGATAYATVNAGGVVTAVTLTAGGTGYATVPSVAFVTNTYVLTVMPGFVYFWGKGANDTGAPGLSVSGTFYTGSSPVLLTGSGNVTATVYAVNMRPYIVTIPITNGAHNFSVTGLTLPFTPMGAEASVMLPNSSAVPLDAKPDYSSLSATGVKFYLQTAAPSSGYIAIVKIY